MRRFLIAESESACCDVRILRGQRFYSVLLYAIPEKSPIFELSYFFYLLQYKKIAFFIDVYIRICQPVGQRI